MASSRARHDGCFIVLLSRKCVKPKTLSDQQVWGCDYDYYDNDDFDDDNEDNDDFDDDNDDDWKLFLCAVAVFYESILIPDHPYTMNWYDDKLLLEFDQYFVWSNQKR